MMIDGWMAGMGWLWSLFLVLLVLLLWVALYFGVKAGGRAVRAAVASSPENVLRVRYARGEIGAEELEERLRRLDQ